MGPPPVLTRISPREGPTSTKITIRGENLGISPQDLVGMFINGCDCLLISEWKTDKKIVVLASVKGDIIIVKASGGMGSSSVQVRIFQECRALTWRIRPPTSLQEMFPESNGDIGCERFDPAYFLLEQVRPKSNICKKNLIFFFEGFPEKDYDRVIKEYERARPLYGNSDEPLFQTYLAEAEKGVQQMRSLLSAKLREGDLMVEQQKKFTGCLTQLEIEGDPACELKYQVKVFLRKYPGGRLEALKNFTRNVTQRSLKMFQDQLC